VSQTPTEIEIPAELRPIDGRFASGPSKVRPEAVAALAEIAPNYLGTSHRKPAVKDIVGRLRSGLEELFALPDDWEVVLGNGGTTLFWDAATFGLIDARSQHLSFGEFSSKFAAGVATAPFLASPIVISSDTGTHPEAVADPSVDFYAFTHNETSTGVSMPLVRPAGANDDAIVAVDATSAAGAIAWDPAEVDCYYFAPQKAIASDGGLWIALCSPRAQERIQRIADGPRWIPPGLDLAIALDNSTKNQTYNTPALATVFLAMHQVEWFNSNGGMSFSAGRSAELSSIVYDWAEAAPFAAPFVSDPAKRSPVVATIDFDDSVSADDLSEVLRTNGILDTEGYRKLGRNQLRIACFPAIERDDMVKLTKSLDFVVGRLTGN
jgi:phosphoserine aminotransferase